MPAPDGIPQRRHRGATLAVGDQDDPTRPGRRGLERLRAEECGERGELTGGGARCLELLGADGELDESREQPRALDVISLHVGERALELPETDARLPLGEPE